MTDAIADGINTRTGRLVPPADVEPLETAIFRQLQAVIETCAQAADAAEAELSGLAASVTIRLAAVAQEFNAPDPLRVRPTILYDEQLINQSLALHYLQRLLKALSSTLKMAKTDNPAYAALIRDALFVVGARVGDSLIPMLGQYFNETPSTAGGSLH